ncbi:MAG: hypothetical protein U0V18_07560 [Anaerolineales bacterium]
MKRTSKWAIGVVLTAASAFAALQTVSAPTHQVETPTETESPYLTEVVATQPCGYQWAYQDDLELTASFDASIKRLDPNASGKAQLFGEDCIHSDGTATFIAKETDFYVRTKVDDLNKEEEFGNWVKQVMEIVLQIPREDLAIQYGFVEFHFEKTEAEFLGFRVPIQTYIDTTQDKTSAELFQMFYAPP